MVRAPDQYVAEVREHYEELPYPFVDVEKEREQFCASDSYCLDALNHYGWAGMRDLRHARFLIAGEGAGDMSVFFAEQLRGTQAEIVAIDLSQASINIAKARLKKRGLTNVTHHHLSLLDLPTAELGTFDVIECGGVLHHLEDPNTGLRALTSVLKEDGLLAVMVYAQYGRMAIYMLQDLMRQLVAANASSAEKIAAARAFLNQLPPTHWFAESAERFISDIEWPDGSGIYDLFLHSTDRAYTVPQIYDWLDQAGLTLTTFFDEQMNDMAYAPEMYVQDQTLLSLLHSKPARERHAMAELMHGNMYKHHFFAGLQEKTPAMPSDDMVMVWALVQGGNISWVPHMQAALELVQVGQRVYAPHEQRVGMPPIALTRRAQTVALLGMIDGVTPIGDMVEKVAAASGSQIPQVRAELSLLYRELFNNKRVFLRHKSIAPYVTYSKITQRLTGIAEIA